MAAVTSACRRTWTASRVNSISLVMSPSSRSPAFASGAGFLVVVWANAPPPAGAKAQRATPSAITSRRVLLIPSSPRGASVFRPRCADPTSRRKPSTLDLGPTSSSVRLDRELRGRFLLARVRERHDDQEEREHALGPQVAVVDPVPVTGVVDRRERSLWLRLSTDDAHDRRRLPLGRARRWSGPALAHVFLGSDHGGRQLDEDLHSGTRMDGDHVVAVRHGSVDDLKLGLLPVEARGL